MKHPYRELPSRNFWSRGVASDFNAADVPDAEVPLIRKDDRIVSAGSCFAANLVPYLEKSGFEYVRTELTEPIYDELGGEALSYSKFSAAYGNIYTTRHLLQLWKRCLGEWTPTEDRWQEEGEVIDPFRPGLRFRSRSNAEFDLVTNQHLRRTATAFIECDVFIFTLGLTEAWVSSGDGAVYPACPGTIAGSFNPERHSFVNFTANEVEQDLREFILSLREWNSKARFILTVSPVPLVATASASHVLAATTYSKSALRVAAEHVAQSVSGVVYFPSYEIVTGPQAPWDYFEADRRSVSTKAVDDVMAAFLAKCDGSTAAVEHSPSAANRLSEANKLLSDIECEEAGQEL